MRAIFALSLTTKISEIENFLHIVPRIWSENKDLIDSHRESQLLSLPQTFITFLQREYKYRADKHTLRQSTTRYLVENKHHWEERKWPWRHFSWVFICFCARRPSSWRLHDCPKSNYRHNGHEYRLERAKWQWTTVKWRWLTLLSHYSYRPSTRLSLLAP